MNFIFWGLLYNKEKEQHILNESKVGLQGATNTFQWNLIDGLIDNNIEFNIVNTISVGCYPKAYKKLRIKTNEWSYKQKIKCHEIGFTNLLFIKQKQREKNFYKKTTKLLKEEEENVIIIYSLYLPFLRAVKKLKKKYKNLKVVLIVPDIPGQYGTTKSKIKAPLYKYLGNKVIKNSQIADGFVLLTEEMKTPLQIGSKPYCVVEGMAPKSKDKNIRKNVNKKEKILLFTGSVSYQSGIDNLCNAMQYLPKDYKLWICGKGNFEHELMQICKQNTRVQYFGYRPKEEIVEMQKEATLLINSRANEGAYTKYSFPSKTIEYMSSGTPVLMFRLDGIPKEYDEYLYYFKENEPKAMAIDIKQICELDDFILYEKGINAYNFIQQNKNAKIQVLKLLNMIKNIH